MRCPQYLTVLVLILATVVDCGARICTPSRTEKDEGLQYLTNLIDSFGFAKEGLANLTHPLTTPQNAEELGRYATDVMLKMKRASEEYECAATLVEPYTKAQLKQFNLGMVNQ
jgi:hypothetical protein